MRLYFLISFLLFLLSPLSSARTVIVGAGLSGLRTAEILSPYEEVVVLEAEPEVGGRVHSVNFHGLRVEDGAEFVDSNNREILEIIRIYNLEHPENPIEIIRLNQAPEASRFEYGNRFIDRNELNRQVFLPSEISALRHLASRSGGPFDDRESLSDLFDLAQGRGLSSDTRRFFETVIFAETGALGSALAAESFFEHFEIDLERRALNILPHADEAFKIRGGTSRIVQALEEILLRRRVDVRTNSRVSQITGRPGNYRVTYMNNGVESTVSATNLVINTPPWNLGGIEIDVEGVDPRLLRDLANLPHANTTKMYLFFDERFWAQRGNVIASGYLNGATPQEGFLFVDSSQGQPGPRGVILMYSGQLVNNEEERREMMGRGLAAFERAFPGAHQHHIGTEFFSFEGSYTQATLVNSSAWLQRLFERLRALPSSFWLVGESYSRSEPGYMEGALRRAWHVAMQILGPGARCEVSVSRATRGP